VVFSVHWESFYSLRSPCARPQGLVACRIGQFLLRQASKAAWAGLGLEGLASVQRNGLGAVGVGGLCPCGGGGGGAPPHRNPCIASLGGQRPCGGGQSPQAKRCNTATPQHRNTSNATVHRKGGIGPTANEPQARSAEKFRRPPLNPDCMNRPCECLKSSYHNKKK
jgi:hypothetical protein